MNLHVIDKEQIITFLKQAQICNHLHFSWDGLPAKEG